MKNPLTLLKEMIITNRTYIEMPIGVRIDNFLQNLFSTETTIDDSKANYYLARSVMKGRVITDARGVRYGVNLSLASGFGKPIVSAIIGLLFVKQPSISSTDKDSQEYADTLNDWFTQNQSTVLRALRRSVSEGDGYLLIKDTYDAKPVGLLPENVEPIVDPFDYTNIIGYEVYSRVRTIENGSIVYQTYKTIYRRRAPFKITVLLARGGIHPMDVIVEVDGRVTRIPLVRPELYMQTLNTVDDFKDLFSATVQSEERPLPIVPFHHMADDQAIRGESVFGNLYVYFKEYHKLLDHSIANTIFNLVSIPIIKGVKNIEDFLRRNGEYDANNKKYKLQLDPKKVFFDPSKDFDIKMLQSGDTVGGAKELLNILFYLISQASETPEYYFGVAVASSKASTDNQVDILNVKATTYKAEYYEEMVNLFKTVSYYKRRNGDVTINRNYEFLFKWADMDLSDPQTLLEYVQYLKGENIITRQTAASILGMHKHVDDLTQEIENAVKEDFDTKISFDQQLIGGDDLTQNESRNDNQIENDGRSDINV